MMRPIPAPLPEAPSADLGLDRDGARRLLQPRFPEGQFDVAFQPASGRNRLFVARNPASGRALLLKQSASMARHTGEAWATSYPPLTRITPDVAFVDENSRLIAFEYEDHAQSLRDISLAEPADGLDAWASFGSILGLVHSQDGDFAPSSDWRSAYPSLDPIAIQTWLHASAGARQYVREVQLQSELVDNFEAVRRGIGPFGLIHADIKADNLLLAEQRPLLLDWELAGVGPLALDVGGSLGSILVTWVRGLLIDSDTSIAQWIADGAVPFDAVQRSAASFISEYLASLSPEIRPPSLDAVVQHTSAWLVGRTWAEATRSVQLTARGRVHLLVAENLLHRPFELLGDVRW